MFYFGILGTFAIVYWIGLIALFPIMIIGVAVSANRDKFSWCVFWTVIGATIAHVIGLFDVVGFFSTNWHWLLGGFAAYLLLSFPYARFVEWRRYLPKLYKQRDEEEKREIESFWLYWRTDKPAGERALQERLKERGYSEPILARNYKGKFVGWMVWWPYKLFYRIAVQWIIEFFERIRDLFRWIVEKLMYQLQQDADNAFKKHADRKKEKVPSSPSSGLITRS